MEIRFKIPNGAMCIQTSIFLGYATTAQIRKMLKLYSASDPDPEEVKLLNQHLMNRVIVCRSDAIATGGDILRFGTEIKEKQELYQKMKSPCYAEFTRDKDKQKNLNLEIARMRRLKHSLEADYKRVQSEIKRYLAVQSLLQKHFVYLE